MRIICLLFAIFALAAVAVGTHSPALLAQEGTVPGGTVPGGTVPTPTPTPEMEGPGTLPETGAPLDERASWPSGFGSWTTGAVILVVLGLAVRKRLQQQ